MLLREVRSNRRISTEKLKSQVKVYFGKHSYTQTIINAIHQKEFKGWVAIEKPFISKRN